MCAKMRDRNSPKNRSQSKNKTCNRALRSGCAACSTHAACGCHVCAATSLIEPCAADKSHSFSGRILRFHHSMRFRFHSVFDLCYIYIYCILIICMYNL